MKQGNFSLFHCLGGHLSLLDIFPLNVQMSISFLSFFHSHTFHSFLNTKQKLAIPKVNSKFIVSWKVYKLEFLGNNYIFFQRIIIWSD